MPLLSIGSREGRGEVVVIEGCWIKRCVGCWMLEKGKR